jgi:hypothetical protein
MIDTYCHGKGCLIKEHCLRYNQKKLNELGTSYFDPEPHIKNENGFYCEMLYTEHTKNINQLLKDIVNGKI